MTKKKSYKRLLVYFEGKVYEDGFSAKKFDMFTNKIRCF